MMHETILKGVTVGIVGGLIVYWLTSRHHANYSGRSADPNAYAPLLGDVRRIGTGRGTVADCNCCGLPAPENSTTPLAADFLDCSPEHAPAISSWNLGVSLQLSCEGIDLHSCITRKETASSFPLGIAGPDSTPPPAQLVNHLSCDPNVPITVSCTEVV